VTWSRVNSNSGAGLPGQVKRSPMLTVWRKLHIEQDSYGRPGVGVGGEINHVAGTAASYTWYPTMGVAGATVVDVGNAISGDFGEDNQFKFGRYIVGGTTYTVSNCYNDLSWPYHDTITIFGINLTAPPGVALGPYELYDDDEGSLAGGTWTLTDLVPAYPKLDDVVPAWKAALAKAYIVPDYLLWSDVVVFKRHLKTSEVGAGTGEWNDYHQRTTEKTFWTAFVFSAFQGDIDKDNDGDGDDTNAVFGAERSGPFADHTECVLYLETIRDAGEDVGQVMLHELGHTGGCADDDCVDGCIMQKDSSGHIGDHFCNKCLNELRGDDEWGE